MADSTHKRSRSPAHGGPGRRSSKSSLSRAGLAAALLLAVLAWPSPGFAQKPRAAEAVAAPADEEKTLLEKRKLSLEAQKLELENPTIELEHNKLELEISKLEKDLAEWPEWWRTLIAAAIAAVVGIGSGLLTNYFAFRLAHKKKLDDLELAHKKKLDDLDQAVHQQRLELYPRLTAAASPLAIFFPSNVSSGSDGHEEVKQITPDVCKTMGRAMSAWYFGEGGLLLSEKSRDAYFRLLTTLTLASNKATLNAPDFSEEAGCVSVEKVDNYRGKLGIRTYSMRRKDWRPKERKKKDLEEIEDWKFGEEDGTKEWIQKKDKEWRDKEREWNGKIKEYKFAFDIKDYVFLQQLASLLRTELTKDIHSRRRPAG